MQLLCSALAQVLGRIAEELVSVLSGKAGVLAQWYQRHCLVVALRSCAGAARALAAPVPNAAVVATGLAPLAEKEAHEETRALAFLGLAEWIALAVDAAASGDVVPAAPLAVLSAALSGSKPSAPAIAGAAELVVLRPGVAAAIGKALLPGLTQRVEDAKARPGAGQCISHLLYARLCYLHHLRGGAYTLMQTHAQVTGDML
jgi:hypothetical protein